MNKTKLTQEISIDTGEKLAVVERVLNSTLDLIVQSINDGNPVVIKRFGTFKPITKKARTMSGGILKEPVAVPESKSMVLTVSTTVKTKLNEE